MKPKNDRQRALFSRGPQLTEQQVRRALWAALNFDPRKAYDGDGCLLPPELWPDEIAFAVTMIETQDLFNFDRDGKHKIGETKKVRFMDRGHILNLAMRHFGMFQADKPNDDSRDLGTLSEIEILDRAEALRDSQRALEDRGRALAEKVPEQFLRVVSTGPKAA